MLRALPLVLAVLVAHGAFIVATAPGAICLEGCPDDGPDGRCPPICLSCPCAPHPAPPSSLPRIAAPSTRPEAVPALAAVATGEPEPRDIFHVPKSLLA